MKSIEKLIKWIGDNKQWVFCGIGITIVPIFCFILIKIMGMADVPDYSATPVLFIEGNGKHSEINSNIYQNSIIYNFDKDIENNQLTERELVIDIDGEKIYPISIDIKDEKKVGDWVYFIYMIEENYGDETIIYPVLFKYQKDICIAERVNERACYSFDIIGDAVYYLDSTTCFQDHGELYVTSPDGKSKRLLEEELYDFQIVDEKYIYYTYRYDTVGVGLEGHALHRMNLDGSDIMISAYEASGADFGISHFEYKVVDGWVDCGTFKMEIGEPASGFEKIVFKDIGDNDWIYYVTNRLIKARKDGSEIVELDGEDDYYYSIEKIEDDWIYYIKGGDEYKIRTDGNGKELITHE